MTPSDPLYYLLSMDAAALLAAFSFSIILDLPRYTFGFLAVLLVELGSRRRGKGAVRLPTVSIIIAGHNEAASIRRCVISLREQTVRDLEIICVDDGSTDGMADELYRLRAENLIDVALVCRVRCGKSSACNLALSRARGEAVVNVDVDCTFDRDAIENIVCPLANPEVGAVCGNIAVRNAGASFIARMQVVEYVIGISLGKRALDFFNVVACASGAFSAFRRVALEGVGGMDVGPGEDLDLTLRLRQAGWRIRFAHNAWCLTDVPATVPAFVRQRLRWERDALRIRLRKHRRILDPRDRGATATDLVHQFDYIVTNLLVTLVFPVYLGWLLVTYGDAAWMILGSVTLGYVVLDLISFLAALVVVDRPGLGRALPYALLFGAFNAYFVRAIRLVAYAQEWIFRRSFHDAYVPARVRKQAPLY
ncbi:MAG: glycosyltransferase family 2 protein [Rhodospirillales bacterium]|nr:glycosyltransferase family 2 protein [Rhodospirillales bacterium]